MKNFGKRLKELRTQYHLSQEELAKRLGVTSQAVSKWETGKSTPDFAAIVPMAKLFQLLGYEGPHQDWEYRWQSAMRAGDPAEARRIAAEAQQPQSMAGHFSYRQAEAEAVLARKTKDPEEKRQLLASAEQRLRDILKEYPEFEGAALQLVSVLLAQGRRQDAEETARGYPNGLFTLLLKLKKDAAEDLKMRAITARAAQFETILRECGDLRALDLAERFLREMPWQAPDRANLLSAELVERACLLCEMGDTDGAMAALERLRELMRPAEEQDGDASALTFLRLIQGHEPSEEWIIGLSFLEDTRLKPLEGREEYQALLALAEKHGKEN